MKKTIFMILLLISTAFAEITLIDDIMPKNDDGIGGNVFDVIVDVTRIGDAATDSCIDMNDDGLIDRRRLELFHKLFSITPADGEYMRYYSTGDTLGWDTPAGGSTIKWWDSLYIYGDTTKILYDLIDTTTAKIPTATLADSTVGGAVRATTCKTADSTDGGATRAETSALADSCVGGAARAEVADDLDLIGWGLETDNDSLRIDADSLNVRIADEINDTIQTHWITAEWGIGLTEDDSIYVDSSELDDVFLMKKEFDDSLDAAGYLDSSNIANQGIVPDDIDTTDNIFVFSDVRRGDSDTGDSSFVTIETIEDSLALCRRFADTLTKSFVIAAPDADFDFPFWQTKKAITITAVSAVCTGGTNVIGALQEYNATGTSVDAAVDGDWTITTSEYTDASFTNAGIDAGDWVGWKTTSVSGSVGFFSITFEYTE